LTKGYLNSLDKKVGIYLLLLQKNSGSSFYIGQSNDINARIKHHISTLKENKHHNIFLQIEYNDFKKKDLIKSSILELLPKEITCPLEAQRWLKKREEYHITFYKNKSSKNLNIAKPEIVETSAARKVFNKERQDIQECSKSYDLSIKEQKCANTNKINQAQKELLKIKERRVLVYKNADYKIAQEKLLDLAGFKKRNTGIRRFFNFNDHERSVKNEKLRKLETVQEEISAITEKANYSDIFKLNHRDLLIHMQMLKKTRRALKTTKQIKQNIEKHIRVGNIPGMRIKTAKELNKFQ